MSIHPDYTDIIQFVFENGDKMPEGFYIELMDLIKKVYLNQGQQNLEKINQLLESNRNVVDKNILRVLNKTFKIKRPLFYNFYKFNYMYFRYHCLGACIFGSLIIIIIGGSGVGIVWTIIRR